MSSGLVRKYVSMTRKCQNHRMQTILTTPQGRDTEQTAISQLKQSNQLPLPHLDDNAKTNPQDGSNTQNPIKLEQQQTMNKQQQNHRIRTDSGQGEFFLRFAYLRSLHVKIRFSLTCFPSSFQNHFLHPEPCFVQRIYLP